MFLTKLELEILELRKKGLTQVEIADYFNISQSMVSQYLNKINHKLFNTKNIVKSSRNILTSTERKIISFRKEGYSQREIADYFNISQSAVSQFLKNSRKKIQNIINFKLTDRQSLILRLIKKNYTQKEIAKILKLSQPSISHSVKIIKWKYRKYLELSKFL